MHAAIVPLTTQPNVKHGIDEHLKMYFPPQSDCLFVRIATGREGSLSPQSRFTSPHVWGTVLCSARLSHFGLSRKPNRALRNSILTCFPRIFRENCLSPHPQDSFPTKSSHVRLPTGWVRSLFGVANHRVAAKMRSEFQRSPSRSRDHDDRKARWDINVVKKAPSRPS
jgi:hypothetical protein